MKNVIKVIGVGVLIGVILFSLELVLRLLSGNDFSWDWQLLDILGLYVFYSVPLSFVNGYFFDFLNRKVEWDGREKRRLLFSFAGSVVVTVSTAFLLRTIHQVVILQYSFSEFIEGENLQFYFIVLIITLVLSLFFHALEFYKIAQERKVKEQQVIAGTASAKFESLKNQIDPHFLFNSLNVLTSLIEENPEHAQKFTTSLSKIYRYVLEQKDKELVSLEEELRFAVSYMKLLKMRFEDSVFYEIPEQLSNPDAKVVPLSLQLLLENTVKHNVVSASKPLMIRIYEENGFLVVENDIQKKEVFQERKGVGLQNILSRYGIVTKRKVIVEENDRVFRVKLPILTKKVTFMETNEFNEDAAYYKAKQRVKEIKEFYGNLASYCLVIPFLIFINYISYWSFQWFWFPVFGWGLGLAIHGISVFGYGSRWEEKKIRELMQKDRQQNTWK